MGFSLKGQVSLFTDLDNVPFQFLTGFIRSPTRTYIRYKVQDSLRAVILRYFWGISGYGKSRDVIYGLYVNNKRLLV